MLFKINSFVFYLSLISDQLLYYFIFFPFTLSPYSPLFLSKLIFSNFWIKNCYFSPLFPLVPFGNRLWNFLSRLPCLRPRSARAIIVYIMTDCLHNLFLWIFCDWQWWFIRNHKRLKVKLIDIISVCFGIMGKAKH